MIAYVRQRGKRKNIKNGLAYALRYNRNWQIYAKRITIHELTPGASVRIHFSDGTTVYSTWADFTVAQDYFTRRTRAFKGVELRIYTKQDRLNALETLANLKPDF